MMLSLLSGNHPSIRRDHHTEVAQLMYYPIGRFRTYFQGSTWRAPPWYDSDTAAGKNPHSHALLTLANTRKASGEMPKLRWEDVGQNPSTEPQGSGPASDPRLGCADAGSVTYHPVFSHSNNAGLPSAMAMGCFTSRPRGDPTGYPPVWNRVAIGPASSRFSTSHAVCHV
jgi:hypothetical protein